MFINPIHFLARLLVMSVVRVFKLPTNFNTTFSLLFTVAGSLVRTVGIIPTFRVINGMRNALRNMTAGGATANFQSFAHLLANTVIPLNRYVHTKLINCINPIDWALCFENFTFFKRIFIFIFWPFFALSLFSPILKWICRVTSGIILSAVGYFLMKHYLVYLC